MAQDSCSDVRMENLLRALRSYGVEIGSEDLNALAEGAETLSEKTVAQIDGLSTNGDIARQLVTALVERHAEIARTNGLWKRAKPVYDALSALFDVHMELWKAMVDAARGGRAFTDVELDCFEGRIALAQDLADEASREAGGEAFAQAQAACDRELKLRYRLQFDEQMIADIDRLVGNVASSRPSLIVGDKGIAKTQVAKFVMSLYGEEPIVVSVKGDMMSDELIGHLVHDRERQTFVFEEGALVRAMREGRPILLDEINFGDQSIIARLQDILVKIPGESAYIQEEDATVTVAPGFAVLATANEASLRYRHREVLDPAIRDRFDIVARSYPDIEGTSFLDSAPNLMRLALSSAVDEYGKMSRHIDEDMLRAFVRMAHATQYLYSVPTKDITVELSSDEATGSVRDTDHPLMTDCITPRTLSNIVADCAEGNLPGRRFDIALLDRIIDTLDQAGSRDNAEVAQQLKVILNLAATE